MTEQQTTDIIDLCEDFAAVERLVEKTGGEDEEANSLYQKMTEQVVLTPARTLPELLAKWNIAYEELTPGDCYSAEVRDEVLASLGKDIASMAGEAKLAV